MVVVSCGFEPLNTAVLQLKKPNHILSPKTNDNLARAPSASLVTSSDQSCILVPECSLQHLTLCKIQQLRPSRLQWCHLHITSSIHWPGASTQMMGFVKKCPSSMYLSPNLYLPTYLWEKVATDQAIWILRTALPTPCDVLLMIFRIQPLTTIISACNEVCLFQAWQPEHHIVSDNGPQYNSAKMKALALSYRFKHITSSPTTHRAMVKSNTQSKLCRANFKILQICSCLSCAIVVLP